MLPNSLSFLNCIDQRDLSEVRNYLTQYSFVTLEVDGSTITDAKTFYKAARNIFPSDPPFGPIVSWDGFVDSFFGGLDTLGEPRVAVVWTHVEKMLSGNLRDLLAITQCINDVATQVISPGTGITVPVTLTLFLLGEGENFLQFDRLPMNDRESVIARCQTKVQDGASRAELVVFLHDEGLTIIDSVRILRDVCQLPLGEAKKLVTSNPVWADEVRSAESLHDEIEAALRSFESPPN